MPALSGKLHEISERFPTAVLMMISAFGFVEPLVLSMRPLLPPRCVAFFDCSFPVLIDGAQIVAKNIPNVRF